jgi:hypothetical protein
VKILITHFRLADRTASESSVRDLARALRGLGHDVGVFVTKKGPLAEEVESVGVPVVSHPADCPFRPDLIHGHYNLETIAALLCYPDRPALYLSHGTRQWREHPPQHPRILRYLAHAQSGREGLVESGIPRESCGTVPGFVEMDRFATVRRLPEEPKRALFYDRTAGQGKHVDEIRQACLRCGIQLEFVGDLVGKSPTRPEIMLPEYDLVFASGRSAIEALACGCAVVVVRDGRCGKLVTTANFDAMRDEHFTAREGTGMGTAGDPVAALVQELENWDWRNLAPVARRVREELNAPAVAARFVEVYGEVLALDQERRNNARGELPVLADWLIQLADQHHLVDSGFLALQHRASSLKSVREETENRTEELGRLLEMEKAKVRAARKLFKEGNPIHQGLWKRIEAEWREIERQHLGEGDGGPRGADHPPPGSRAGSGSWPVLHAVRDFAPVRDPDAGVELPG